MKKLTPQEKQAVKVLNFIARYDGIIQCEDDIILLLQHGIEKFIKRSVKLTYCFSMGEM